MILHKTNFKHQLAAHCESGAVTSLLNHSGIQISEAMVFGISGAIFFAYINNPTLPFPTIAVRNQPGKIHKNFTKFSNVAFERRQFRNPEIARNELDSVIRDGTPAGVQVDFFYMDYVPEYLRAHFNGHFVIIVGEKDDKYIISDAYTPTLVELDKETVLAARFAKGPFKPKGLMIYRNGSGSIIDYEKAILKGIKNSAFNMLKIPIPFLGVKGIRYFAKKLPEWPKLARDEDHLSHEIMMINILLEERGTGGGGFRFMYAAFLQESAKILNKPALNDIAEQMMNNGDEWRQISIFAGKIGRARDLGQEKLQELAGMIEKRADVEKQLFTDLKKIVK
jgi:hypothetical protein